MKLAILPLTLLTVAGCATTNSGRSINPDLVTISKAAKPGCETIAQLSVTANRRGDLTYTLQEEASSKGANYVQVTSLRYSMNTHKIKATGIAMLCTVDGPEKASAPRQGALMDEVAEEDSLATSAMVSGLGDDKVYSPDMTDDGNPFQ